MNQDSQKRYLSDYTKEELGKLSVDQVQQLFMETLKEIVEVSETATRHINQLDEYRKKAEQSEDAKTLSLFNQSDKDMERTFVETMSSGARAHDEYIQARRDARCEEMIQEAGEIESPANRLHH